MRDKIQVTSDKCWRIFATGENLHPFVSCHLSLVTCYDMLFAFYTAYMEFLAEIEQTKN